jgi:hypothetical protein
MKKVVRSLIVVLSVVGCIMTAKVNALEVTGKIYRLYANGENLYVRLKDDSCVTGNGYYRFVLDSDYKQYMSAILLAAANANKPVTIGLDACPLESKIANASYLVQVME